jgi:membrane protein implicated in regulation of membrane protease activity
MDHKELPEHECGISSVAHHLIGEICCVSKTIQGRRAGHVRHYGCDFPAVSEGAVKKGRWVRVTSACDGIVYVTPLNVWLGSSCCR